MKSEVKFQVSPLKHSNKSDQREENTEFEGGEIWMSVEYSPEEFIELIKSQELLLKAIPAIITAIRDAVSSSFVPPSTSVVVPEE
jgi:hypothetical protein